MPFVKSPRLPRPLLAGVTLCVSLSGVISAQPAPAKKSRSGVQVYAQLCASCHGAKGEGSKQYAKALAGAQSEAQLTAFITRAMPPGGKHKWAPGEAKAVSSFVYHRFYSPIAQERNRPARVELSRLTVRQYRNAVADLIAGFRGEAKLDDRRGLRAEYFKSRRFRREERVVERVDPEVRFDWGKETPAPEMDPHLFSARWEGSVTPVESGDYEFVVKTEHMIRFWINDLNQPAIDATVKSGSDNEYRASAYLIGGRVYPLRLEFSKSKQGVDDSEKLKGKPVDPASISLSWQPPHRPLEPIPARSLTPAVAPRSFALATMFPPDDRSLGYERGTSVSKAWDDATTEGALETAAYVAANLRELSGVADDAPDRPAKLRDFCRRFAARAFRRPLTPELEQVVVDRQFDKSPDLEVAVKRSVILTLKSPRFLYRELSGSAPDAYDVASRLSFGLWDSLPDAELLRAAAANELGTREQVAAQARRMLTDLRAQAKLRDFFLQWVKVDHYPDLAKDKKRFPDFDEATQADLRTSFELTLQNVVMGDKPSFRELFLSDKVVLNGRLAKLYGVNLPADAPFQPVALDASDRAGLLTHPYLLASLAYLDGTSPIHRGVMIARSLLGRTLQPPPDAFTPLPADLHPKLTTRQRVALQTKPPACAGCHNMINPLGFTLERFDAIGRLRTLENGSEVDATGSYQPVVGKQVKFAGVRDLAQFLAGSSEAQNAFAEKLFQYLAKQPIRAYGTDALPNLGSSFEASGFNIREQVVESAVVAAMKR